ncbi:hypothetical protein T02_1709, partial [Trichinella nativa]
LYAVSKEQLVHLLLDEFQLLKLSDNSIQRSTRHSSYSNGQCERQLKLPKPQFEKQYRTASQRHDQIKRSAIASFPGRELLHLSQWRSFSAQLNVHLLRVVQIRIYFVFFLSIANELIIDEES